MKWDIKGNMLMHNKDGHNIGRFCWTEDNRLQAAHGYQTPVFYNYAASGDRNLKLTGEYVNVWVNGGNANIPVLNNQVLYASALVTINNKEYTKHYYEEGRRIASAIGGGGFNGTQDLVEPIVDDYETQINNQNEGLQSTFTNCLPNMTVNIQTDNLYELTVQSNEPIIIPNEPHYYYLTDHLGSTSYIVNDSAQITQKLAYMPFGEDFVDLNYNTPYP
ncbi:MAG: hypothetical protein LBR28_07730, partial [Bacteroidales bacterium]|nr:hypothetical protein [Bacteroidales bacterium]